MLRILILFFFLVPALVSAQFVNVVVGDTNDPTETSIAFDVNHPNRLLAGAVYNLYYLSNDTGKTWTQNFLSSSYGVWGDPVMLIDTAGDYYFIHLSNPVNGSWIDRIVCQKSKDGGLTWSDGTYVGLNGTKKQDKPWAAIDRSNNHIYLCWTEFDNYNSNNPLDSTRILFSKSIDAGDTWSTPVRISKNLGNCVDADSTVEGAVPAIGPNGEIYTAWSGPLGIVFQKSLDGGQTWLPEEQVIASQPGGWDYDIPGLNRCNGMPITLCDTSQKSTRGTIYVNWSDQRNGIDDTDIWMISSIDQGATWTSPVRVNDDGLNHHQFMCWATIDQTNGHVYSVFYDRRNHTNNATDVFLAYSVNGGSSFTNMKISETPFVPSANLFFGDYTGIVAHNREVRPIWARMHNGFQTVHTALIKFDTLVGVENQQPNLPFLELEQNAPNPVINETMIAFKLKKRAEISITIFDIFGRQVAQPILDEVYDRGRYKITVEVNNQFKTGVYYYQLSSNNDIAVKKMVVL